MDRTRTQRDPDTLRDFRSSFLTWSAGSPLVEKGRDSVESSAILILCMMFVLASRLGQRNHHWSKRGEVRWTAVQS